MKYRHILFIVFLILLIDQIIKIYIKTHFYYGESVAVAGNWFQLLFIENEGMAFGMKIMDNELGKIMLTSFRLLAVGAGFYWMKKLVQKKYSIGLLVCGAFILAGAAGNLIDSLFYGMIFSESTREVAQWVPWGKGYSSFMHGRVVDMFYFPIIDTTWPNWVPMVGGKTFRFFEPIFNFADAAISIGVIVLVLFQKRWMNHTSQEQNSNTAEIPN